MGATPDPVRFTLAICTHNRAVSLERALSSIIAARAPGVPFEVLVVLNACTDRSAQVVESLSRRLPVRAVAEPQPGISQARNRAVAEARGEVIIFTDDDVRLDRGFLLAYADGFARRPQADVFGGPVVAAFEGHPPRWLTEALTVIGSAYAALAVTDDGAPIKWWEGLPYGPSYALRTAVQRRHPYDTNLGRAPVGWIRNGEESGVMEAALKAGATGRWLAGPILEHIVPRERQSERYLWRYYEGHGRLMGLIRRYRLADDLTRRMVRSYLRYRRARLTMPPPVWAKALVEAAIRRGEWIARRELRRAEARPGEAEATSR